MFKAVGYKKPKNVVMKPKKQTMKDISLMLVVIKSVNVKSNYHKMARLRLLAEYLLFRQFPRIPAERFK
jgi:hypothetical protein